MASTDLSRVRRQYPQARRSLAPRLFAHLLQAELPAWARQAWRGPTACPRTLADLAASCWDGFSEQECVDLANLVARTLNATLMNISNRSLLCARPLCRLQNPSNLTPTDLRLSTHTFLRVQFIGCENNLAALAGMTVGDFLRTPYVGIKTVLELVISLEELDLEPAVGSEVEAALSLKSMMRDLPRISGQRCIAALEQRGFRRIKGEGSHVILRRDDPLAQVVIPDHGELDRGTLWAIIASVGIGVQEFTRLLRARARRSATRGPHPTSQVP